MIILLKNLPDYMLNRRASMGFNSNVTRRKGGEKVRIPGIYYHLSGNLINLIITPGHYGRNLSNLLATEKLLIAGIPVQLKELLIMENLDASIEIGASRWDKGMVRVAHKIKFKNKNVDISLVENILEKVAIYPVPEDFGCY